MFTVGKKKNGRSEMKLLTKIESILLPFPLCDLVTYINVIDDILFISVNEIIQIFRTHTKSSGLFSHQMYFECLSNLFAVLLKNNLEENIRT